MTEIPQRPKLMADDPTVPSDSMELVPYATAWACELIVFQSRKYARASTSNHYVPQTRLLAANLQSE